jgi:hypothetical protein
MKNNSYSEPNLIHLSQGHLNLLETCPPKFQNVYLDQLASPTDPEKQEKLSWGSNFHLLMQQLELGLAIEPLLERNLDIKESLITLIRNNPEVFQYKNGEIREAEYSLSLKFRRYLLTVVYDLLIALDFQAQILDWKTYFQAPSQLKLAKNWQTRLYLYVLVETSNYLPEQVTMTYWFVKLPNNPTSITFTYNSILHQKTREDLESLLSQYDRWLDNYLNQGISFPHLPNCQDSCPHYKYLSENQRAVKSLNSQDWIKSIAEIEEMTLKV